MIKNESGWFWLVEGGKSVTLNGQIWMYMGLMGYFGVKVSTKLLIKNIVKMECNVCIV